MDNRKYSFLKAVLGDHGAEAMKKAAERSEAVESVVVPRTIISWLTMASNFDYDGEIPGQEDASITFSKSEQGFEGEAAIKGEVVPFKDVGIFQLAAMVAVALDADAPLRDKVRNIDIARLGKSIDILVRTHKIDLVKKEMELVKKQQGAIAPGAAVMSPPAAPKAPLGPVATQKKRPNKLPKVKVKPMKPIAPGTKPGQGSVKTATAATKVTPAAQGNAARASAQRKSEHQFYVENVNAECPECGMKLVKNDRFIGCLCLRDLAHNVTLTKNEDKYFVSFKGLDPDAVSVILETMGVK